MRNHKTGCGRCHRNVCCCPRTPVTSSCICPPGPPGPAGPAGPPGSDGSTIFPTLSTALYKWSGLSANPASTPAEHSDSGDEFTLGPTPRIEYPVVGDQTLDVFRVNLLEALSGEDNDLTFTLYHRVGGAGSFIPIASVSYATGGSGQQSDVGPFVLADGDTIALESTASGAAVSGSLFTAVLR